MQLQLDMAWESEEKDRKWKDQLEDRDRRLRMPTLPVWTDKDDPDAYLHQFEGHMDS